MKQYEPSRSPCPIGRASRILGDRWVLLILREAFLGADRFEAFMERLPISRAALTSRLAMLLDAGLLERDPPDAKRASYRLTDAGSALQPLYQEMARWGATHLFGDVTPREWSKA
jgi:DNA-binding HxlR family transcriptional regulator